MLLPRLIHGAAGFLVWAHQEVELDLRAVFEDSKRAFGAIVNRDLNDQFFGSLLVSVEQVDFLVRSSNYYGQLFDVIAWQW